MSVDTRARQLVLEPDRAREMAVNLIRERRRFVCEIDPTAPHMKDVVCIAVGAEFQERPEFHYIRLRAVTRDEAAQFVYNCVQGEMSFSVTPETMPDGRTEWLLLAERWKK